METKDLVKLWDAPDNSKLTPRQMSIRLPILVAAKISALADLYPRKTKTEIIGDLLSTALIDLEHGMPTSAGEFVQTYMCEEGEFNRFEDVGVKSRFLKLTEKYLREIESEAKLKEPIEFSSISYHDEIAR